jgi:hypothetical protein
MDECGSFLLERSRLLTSLIERYLTNSAITAGDVHLPDKVITSLNQFPDHLMGVGQSSFIVWQFSIIGIGQPTRALCSEIVARHPLTASVANAASSSGHSPEAADANLSITRPLQSTTRLQR